MMASQGSKATDMPPTPKSSKRVRFRDEPPPSDIPSVFDKLSMNHLLLLGFLLRLGLIIYGVYHDANHALKYTDVDYYVFSDASVYILNPQLLASGPSAGFIAEKWKIYIGSPYDRATYRYTPLLALLLLPNLKIHPLFGKFLFSAADLGIAILQYRSLALHKPGNAKTLERTAKTLVASIWLLNPFVANISTRGSAESILGLIVMLFLFLLETGKLSAAAIVFGLAVHFKIYPLIYASSVLAYLSTTRTFINIRQVKFACISFLSFMLLNMAMYAIWGEDFVEHTYLYHLTRLDHRHNFSHYFYQIYLASSSLDNPSNISNVLFDALCKTATSTFIPQLSLSIGLGFLLIRSEESSRTSARLQKTRWISNSNLACVFFIQTICFTSFNRVCTSQYFMWYLWFLPLVLPKLNFSWSQGLAMLGIWIAGQAVWLSLAYRLEFLGEAVFRELWLAGVGFFMINVGLLRILIGRLEV